MLKHRPAARLMMIVGLLLIPIALLGFLFFRSTNADIASTQKERDGVTLLKAVLPIVAKLSAEGADPSSEDVKNLHLASAKVADRIHVSIHVQKFLEQIERGEAGHDAALSLGRELIVQIGDTSNLILDPELDSYYLMEVVVGRIPELIKLSADLGGHSESHGHEVANLDEPKHQQLAVGEFSASLAAFKTAIRKATESNGSKILDEDLQTLADSYAAKANSHSFAFLTMDEETKEKLEKSGQFELLQQSFANSSQEMWEKAANNLDQLLEYRVDSLRQQQLIAGGTTAIVTLLAIGLAIALLSRIVGKLDEHIVYLAHYDAMTKLKNRSAFTSELKGALLDVKKSNTMSALHLIDVDHFKSINDRLGHQLGDAVLVSVANRLAGICGPQDVIGRLGGDEFVVLQRGIADNWQAVSMADRLVTSLREPLELEDKPFKVSISVGTSVAPTHGENVETVMHSADLALYAAKAAGRDRACMYSDELNSEMIKRQHIENEVRTALAENRFFLNFQAQYSATGKSLRGFEALLRLRTAAGETISPLQFIPVAEQMGLIDEIGAWVLEKAATTAVQWPAQVCLAVNISPLQLKSGKLCDAVRNALQVSGIAPARLEIEVTENILLDDSKSILHQLQEIKSMGVSIALDDFGSGYSSLSYLWRYPFDKLKIDRSFMNAFDVDRLQAENILRTIVLLGHSLQMTVTAEGVETNAQAKFLSTVNCDEIQGFIFSKPVPEQDLAAIMLNAFADENEVRKLMTLLAPDKPEAVASLFNPYRVTS